MDGNTDGQYYDGSVTTTNYAPNAWWQVDLGSYSMLPTMTTGRSCSMEIGRQELRVNDKYEVVKVERVQ